MFGLNFFKTSNEPNKDKHIKELGDDFYLEYDYESNQMGGYHPVNIWLKNTKKKNCNYQITDEHGNFKRFPGVVKGAWEKEIDGKFYTTVRFTFSVSKFVDDICYVIWLVQPDGRYFEDEDGFGGENCSKVRLYSKMNKKGEFICPFTEEYFEGCNQCYML